MRRKRATSAASPIPLRSLNTAMSREEWERIPQMPSREALAYEARLLRALDAARRASPTFLQRLPLAIQRHIIDRALRAAERTESAPERPTSA